MENMQSHLIQCIHNANDCKSGLPDEIFSIEGMTGIKTRHFYNNILKLENANLLEIGCYKGSSTCSFMDGNNASITCIDNWHDFILNELHNNVDKNGPIQEFISNTNQYKGRNRFTFYNEDCFSIDTTKLEKYNIYLYDGDHTYESQYKALTYYINNMEDVFIFIVDDWNWEPVRRGTMDAIRDLKLKNIWSHEIRLTNDDTHTPEDIARNSWWNGCYICILTKCDNSSGIGTPYHTLY